MVEMVQAPRSPLCTNAAYLYPDPPLVALAASRLFTGPMGPKRCPYAHSVLLAQPATHPKPPYASPRTHHLTGNGVAAARHLLQWTERPQACPDPAALTAAMVRLAAERCDVHSPQVGAWGERR